MNKLLKEFDNSDLGLYDGQAGLLLYYNLLNKESLVNKNISYLLCKISQNINTISDLSFSKGLLGICWSLTNVNMDISKSLKSFLGDFDDYIYRSIANYQQNDFSLERGTIGKALYLCQRLKSQKEKNYYRNIALRECLVLLILEIKQFLKVLFDKNLYAPIDGCKFLHVLYAINLLFDLRKIDINNILIDDILYQTKLFIIDYIKNNKYIHPMKYDILLYCIGMASQDYDLLKLCHHKNKIFISHVPNLRYLNIKKLYSLKLPYWYML